MLTNTEQAKIAITADLHQQNWDALYAKPESIKKAEILQNTVTAFVNWRRPFKSVRAPVG